MNSGSPARVASATTIVCFNYEILCMYTEPNLKWKNNKKATPTTDTHCNVLRIMQTVATACPFNTKRYAECLVCHNTSFPVSCARAERRGFNCKPHTCAYKITYIHTYMHAIPQTETFLHPHSNVPNAKNFDNKYQPFYRGTSLEGYCYKVYFLQLDADIVPCGSGSAPELWATCLCSLTRYALP